MKITGTQRVQINIDFNDSKEITINFLRKMYNLKSYYLDDGWLCIWNYHTNEKSAVRIASNEEIEIMKIIRKIQDYE